MAPALQSLSSTHRLQGRHLQKERVSPGQTAGTPGCALGLVAQAPAARWPPGPQTQWVRPGRGTGPRPLALPVPLAPRPAALTLPALPAWTQEGTASKVRRSADGERSHATWPGKNASQAGFRMTHDHCHCGLAQATPWGPWQQRESINRGRHRPGRGPAGKRSESRVRVSSLPSPQQTESILLDQDCYPSFHGKTGQAPVLKTGHGRGPGSRQRGSCQGRNVKQRGRMNTWD